MVSCRRHVERAHPDRMQHGSSAAPAPDDRRPRPRHDACDRAQRIAADPGFTKDRRRYQERPRNTGRTSAPSRPSGKMADAGGADSAALMQRIEAARARLQAGRRSEPTGPGEFSRGDFAARMRGRHGDGTAEPTARSERGLTVPEISMAAATWRLMRIAPNVHRRVRTRWTSTRKSLPW